MSGRKLKRAAQANRHKDTIAMKLTGITSRPHRSLHFLGHGVMNAIRYNANRSGPSKDAVTCIGLSLRKVKTNKHRRKPLCML